MEYLKSVHDKLENVNEDNITYFNLFDYPNLVYGNPLQTKKVNFCKYTQDIQDEMKASGKIYDNIMQQFKSCTCGNRIRFKTDSRHLVLKVEFKESYYHRNMISYNTSGFDIHIVDENKEYNNYSLIAPKEGARIFAKSIQLPANSSICIFLPNFSTIQNMYIGLDKNSKLFTFKYPQKNPLPILFYGNTITQGASASKSGNSYPNIISRILNNDIINLSPNYCCTGSPKTAEMIGNIKCKAIVIDYSRYAPNINFFRETHEKFYRKIREKHPKIKIILLTTTYFNNWKEYQEYDKVIIDTYKNAIARNENTFLINQTKLFEKEDFDLVSIDIGHYTDFGMFKIAETICDILKNKTKK